MENQTCSVYKRIREIIKDACEMPDIRKIRISPDMYEHVLSAFAGDLNFETDEGSRNCLWYREVKIPVSSSVAPYTMRVVREDGIGSLHTIVHDLSPEFEREFGIQFSEDAFYGILECGA